MPCPYGGLRAAGRRVNPDHRTILQGGSDPQDQHLPPTPGAPVRQRGYYEHVIRSSSELDRLRQYIESNPLRWDLDHENPAHA